MTILLSNAEARRIFLARQGLSASPGRMLGKEGLLHISEVSSSHVPKVEDFFKVGDPVLVVVKEIDELGRINLSRKRILENPDDFPLTPEMREFLEEDRKRDSSLTKKRDSDKGRHPRPKRD